MLGALRRLAFALAASAGLMLVSAAPARATVGAHPAAGFDPDEVVVRYTSDAPARARSAARCAVRTAR